MSDFSIFGRILRLALGIAAPVGWLYFAPFCKLFAVPFGLATLGYAVWTVVWLILIIPCGTITIRSSTWPSQGATLSGYGRVLTDNRSRLWRFKPGRPRSRNQFSTILGYAWRPWGLGRTMSSGMPQGEHGRSAPISWRSGSACWNRSKARGEGAPRNSAGAATIPCVDIRTEAPGSGLSPCAS